MSTPMSTPHGGRRIVAWANITLDGYTSGPDGPAHDSWLYEHAAQEQTAEYFEGIWRGADAILLGRNTYVGFHSVWPAMTRDEHTEPRTRDLGRWLDATEKIVISSTLAEAPWENSRITRDLVAEVKTLRQVPGRDVLALSSASVIQALLRADLVDDLRLAMVPVLVGGGLRLLPEGVTARFETVGVTALAHGAVGLHYRRL